MDATCSIDGCERPGTFARGWCGSHYKRWWRHGDPLAGNRRVGRAHATLDERLRFVGWTVRNVRPGLTDCWEWNGLLDKRDYGRIWHEDHVWAASRAAFAAWVGALTDADYVLHRCDNPPCVNPDHLFLGDDEVNTADKMAKRRQANGERSPHHKLTDAQVAEIRAAFTGRWGQLRELATKYDVSASYLSMLTRGLVRKNPTFWEAVDDDLALGTRRSAIRDPRSKMEHAR